MDLGDGWFCFERLGSVRRPAEFQSAELDNLFLDSAHVNIRAAWCISCVDRRLIFFWGDRRQRSSSGPASEGRFGYYERRFKEAFRSFSSVMLAERFESGESTPLKYVGARSTSRSCVAEIFAGRGLLFFYMFEDKEISEEDAIDRRSFLLRCSEQSRQICRAAQLFFRNIPVDVLRADVDGDRLFEEYFGPSAFDPIDEPAVPFIWPWQKCVEVRQGACHPLEIDTVSLVMDVRNSTSAMLLTVDPPKFAMFIDEVVEAAQRIITSHGGYFDKETGDGVVGHFCVPQSDNQSSETVLKVLEAAKMMSLKTTQICDAYQDNLSFSLRGLGCAIGLFAGKAVWLVSWKGIRAIGSSVVNASRICCNAAAGEVGYCNVISRVLKSGEVGLDVFPLDGAKRPIDVSEVRKAALPEASFVKIV